jgi:hypothetical protein
LETSNNGISAQTCSGFLTYTQGGWGVAPNGNNPGTYLNNNFATAFPGPAYLTIGCTNKLQLTSATAVRNFLPNGTTPSLLPSGTKVNPTRSNFSNVFAGQLVALALNLRFDIRFANFAPSTANLKDQIIATGPFRGKTVQFLFDNANLKIGGCSNAFNATLSDYTNAIDNVNRSYDNGTNSGNYVVCPFLAVTCNTTNTRCYNGNSGTMTAYPVGGLPPFTYVWSGAVAGNVQTATNLRAGTYSVTVTDALGVTRTTSCTVGQPTAVVATNSNTPSLCYGTPGSVVVSATGGTPPYTGTGTFSASSGAYNYTVTDANGCTASTNGTMVAPPAEIVPRVTITAARSCASNCDGAASVTVTGGIAPYSYLWSNGSTTTSANNLCGGTSIDVRVTDANGCVVNYDPNVPVPCQPSCDTLTTYTQGGWGATPNGNNPGTYLHAHFNSAFPNGLTIGCTNTLTLTTAQSVTDWLPSGTTPSALPPGNMVDNLTYDNVLAAQLVAATLNVGFDAADSAFDPSPELLGDRYIAQGQFQGMTVNELLAKANSVIGGCENGISYADLNVAVTAFNENNDNGTVDNGFLICTPPAASRKAGKAKAAGQSLSIESSYPIPCHDHLTVDLSGNTDGEISFRFTDMLGRNLSYAFTTERLSSDKFTMNFSGIEAQMIIMTVISNHGTLSVPVLVK